MTTQRYKGTTEAAGELWEAQVAGAAALLNPANTEGTEPRPKASLRGRAGPPRRSTAL